MAFASLFTRLSAVEEDVKSPGQGAVILSNRGGDGQRGNARKRKALGQKAGPVEKSCYQGQTHWTSNATPVDGEPTSFGFNKEGIQNSSDKRGLNNMYNKGQNYKARHNHNVTEQQQQNKTEKHKNLHQTRNKWRDNKTGGHHQTRTTRGGGHSKYRGGMKDVQVKRTRFMTEEFKNTNAIVLEGRLVCRHFLWGRCTKGEECQLEHIQGYNDMIKEACKFYIQGFCTKGEGCPYMHKSFPCKFFHARGKCSQGTDCRFSHDPLTEVTKQLLDELLKREKDLQELTKKAEKEAQGQPADTDKPGITEQNQPPDTLIQSLRPSFYNSGEVNTEQEASSSQTEQLSAVMETAVSPQASDSVPPHSPPSTNLTHKEPVCYSVEAVLGPQLFKPFSSFFTSPGNQGPAPPSAEHTSDCTAGSAAHSEDPLNSDYAVRSLKSTGSHTFGHIATPPTAHIVSNALKIDDEEHSDPLVRRNEVDKPQDKMLHSKSSFQVHTDQIPKTHPNLTLPSEDHKKLGGEMPASLRISHEVKLHPTATKNSVLPKRKGGTHLLVNYECEGSLPFSPTRGKNLTLTPKHPSWPKSHLSGRTSNSQTSIKPVCPSAGFSESRAAVPAEPVTSSAKTSDSGKSDSQTTTDSSSKMTRGGGGGKIQNSPFYSLFESPITDAMKPAADFIKSSCPAPQPAHHRSKDEHVKADKASAFHSLFAAPLSIAPRPCSPPQPDHSNQSPDTTHSSVLEQRARTSETRHPPRFKTSRRPTFAEFSQSPKHKNEDALSEPVNQPTEQVNPVVSSCPSPCSDSTDPPATQAQQPPDITSSKGSAVSADADSVLKSLFLSLSPYQQEEEQQDNKQSGVSSESGKTKKSDTGCAFSTQQQTQSSDHQSPDKTLPDSTGSQPSSQTALTSVEATGGPSCRSPDTPGPQVRNSGSHNLLFKPVVQLMQQHTQLRLTRTSEERKLVNGNVETPLEGLFKTLDTTVFHLGH